MIPFDAEPYLGRGATNIPVSNSEIQVFRECPRKWYLQYYLGLAKKKKETYGPLRLGSRVHESLEKYYKDGVLVQDTYKEELAKDLEVFIASGDDQEPDLVKKFNKEAELGLAMLEGYLEWVDENNLDVNLETIGIEQQLQVPMFDGKLILQGKIDRKVINKDSGKISNMDYKTAISFDVFDKTYNQSEQIRMYSLLEILSETEHRVDGGIYRVLKKVLRAPSLKGSAFKEYYTHLSRTDIESYYRKLVNTLQQMINVRDRLDSGENHLDVVWNNFVRDCSWKCPFYNSCPLLDDGSDFEGYSEEYLEVINPYERYVV